MHVYRIQKNALLLYIYTIHMVSHHVPELPRYTKIYQDIGFCLDNRISLKRPWERTCQRMLNNQKALPGSPGVELPQAVQCCFSKNGASQISQSFTIISNPPCLDQSKHIYPWKLWILHRFWWHGPWLVPGCIPTRMENLIALPDWIQSGRMVWKLSCSRCRVVGLSTEKSHGKKHEKTELDFTTYSISSQLIWILNDTQCLRLSQVCVLCSLLIRAHQAPIKRAKEHWQEARANGEVTWDVTTVGDVAPGATWNGPTRQVLGRRVGLSHVSRCFRGLLISWQL